MTEALCLVKSREARREGELCTPGGVVRRAAPQDRASINCDGGGRREREREKVLYMTFAAILTCTM